MSPTYTVDSNVFIYSMDTRDPAKHRVATQIMRAVFEREGVLPLQCLSESYAACARKRILELDGVSAAIDDALSAYKIIPATSADLALAVALFRQHKLQFFDCLLLSTASAAGCSVILSEDMQDGCTYGSVTVINPFILSPEELAALLA